jgi:hypothetical protein
MRIGARIIKTAIAVMITIYICRTFALEPAFFGAVSAVLNMQPSISLTLKSAKDQILVHVLGVAAALAFGHLLGVNILSVGLITILIISLCLKFNLQSGITMGIVAALFVMGSGPQEFLPHALARTAVIFVGLGTAMLVNILLWPPHYRQQFADKLRESNRETVNYFCTAVHEYVKLESEAPDLNPEQRKKVRKLNKEARVLAEFLGRDGQLFSFGPAEHSDWLTRAEKLIDYNQSLAGKADRIYDLLPVRYERRLGSGTPPLSDEFRAIMELLASGCDTITRINDKLLTVIIDAQDAEPEEINEDYWERMTKAIEEWQPKLTASYYLHGLLELAVVANEIKWGARQAKILLAESAAAAKPQDEQPQ